MSAAARIAAVIIALLCLAPGTAFGAANDKNRPPTKLWETFPLRQQPRSGVQGAVAERVNRPPVAAQRPGGTDLTVWLALSLFGAYACAIAWTIVRMRKDALVVAGGSASSSAPVPSVAAGRLVVPRERCRIAVWRGSVMSQFVAWHPRADGAYAVSSDFRARGRPVVRTPDAERALEDLLAELGRSGWSVVQEGPEWFDRELERVGGGASGGRATRPSSPTDRG